MGRDLRDYRAAFSRAIDLAEEWQDHKSATWRRFGYALNAALMGPDGDDELTPDTEPASCPCACHKPKHEARQPSPLTQIGRLR
jgi:hypothetical protein